MAGKSGAKYGKKKTVRPSSTNGARGAAVKWVGQPIRRKEEARLVSGRGIFVDDEKMPGTLHLKFVRSSYAHAKVTRVDVSKAEQFPGVVCTLRSEEHTSELQSHVNL